MHNNIHKIINSVTEEFRNAKVKKNGYNKHQKFYYFELDDILPVVQKSLAQFGISITFSFENGLATMRLTDVNTNANETFTMPMDMSQQPTWDDKNKREKYNMQPMQYYGSCITYAKRYLLTNVFSITEPDTLDSVDLNNF